MLKRLAALACAALALSAAGAVTAGQITGAGSTFAAPIYGKWSQDYSIKGGDQLNYQSIGSGGGIKQIEAKTVDFGATDMALSPADLEKNDLAQFPTATGGVVPVMNVPGVKPGQIKLTGPILAGIYLGEIKKWNDPKRFTAPPFPGVTLAALEFLHLERHVLMHGHEPLDTDNTAPQFVGEKWLLQHNFAQAEGVANLDQVPESGALIAIGFAKFAGGTGGLARYIAIAPASWPYGTTIDQQSGAPLPTHVRPLRRGADGVLRESP